MQMDIKNEIRKIRSGYGTIESQIEELRDLGKSLPRTHPDYHLVLDELRWFLKSDEWTTPDTWAVDSQICHWIRNILTELESKSDT